MPEISSLIQKMLSLRFSPSKEGRDNILSSLSDIQSYYVIAIPDTVGQNSPSLSALSDKSSNILVFLDAGEASVFAQKNVGCIETESSVAQLTPSALSELVTKSYEANKIQQVKIYTIPPIGFVCSVPEFLNVLKSAVPESETAPAPVCSNTMPSEFIEVDKIKAVLDTYNNEERKKLDPSGRYENAHQVIETLISRNKLDPEELDAKLGFASGFTRNFCSSVVDCSVNKDGLKKLLTFFGLGKYLYLYKKNCLELQEELKKNVNIDCYSLRNVRVSTQEPFKLVGVQRGVDNSSDSYIYGLTLESSYRKQCIVVSSPFGCVVGKTYEIEGLAPIAEQNNPLGVTKAYAVVDIDKDPPVSVPEPDGKIIRPSKPGRILKGSASEQKERQDYIIGYFKKTDGLNYAAAAEKYRVLVEDPDVLEAYYLYLKEKKFGWLARNSVTPQMLVQEYHYPPYEAYCIMARMLDDPNGTMTMLKHRKNEPQYQNPKNQKGRG